MCRVCEGYISKRRLLPVMKVYSGNVSRKELFGIMQMQWGTPSHWQELDHMNIRSQINLYMKTWMDAKQVRWQKTRPLLMVKTL